MNYDIINDAVQINNISLIKKKTLSSILYKFIVMLGA